MEHFKPTFLYIKRHVITRMLYFGKTVKNPEKYKGLGVYWKRIISKHGGEIETLWYCLFLDQESCSEFALLFSKINDIANSNDWANLIDENGLDGALVGHPSFVTDHALVSEKLSKASKLMWGDPEFKERMSVLHKERWTEEEKLKRSNLMKEKWKDEKYRNNHSKKMKGKIGSKKLKGIPKTDEHNKKNSEALKGKKKSKEHVENLRLSASIRRICRLSDRKEMSIPAFTRWMNSLVKFKPKVVDNFE